MSTTKKRVVNQNTLWVTNAFTLFSCCFGSGLLAIPKIATEMGMIPFVLMNLFAVSFCYFGFTYYLHAMAEQDCRVKTLT